MTKEEAALVLENLAIFIKDSFRFMRPEHIEQFKEAYNLAIKALKEPPADVQEVKHGKWHEVSFGNSITVSVSKYYICNQCNHTSQKKTHYCANCGAEMDGKGGGECRA